MVYVCNITIVDNKTNHSNPLSYKTINFSTFYTLFFKFDTVKKLRDAAIFSLQQLRSTTSKTLLSIKGFSDAKVNKIIDAAKKKIEWNSFVNATDILAKQSAAVPISTGSSDLDELLGGGIHWWCNIPYNIQHHCDRQVTNQRRAHGVGRCFSTGRAR